jgi:hypothetical protein
MSCIILLEGVDKTGKSTEANRLARHLETDGPVRVVHFGVPETNPYQTYRRALLEADRFDGSTVLDRLHWSNQVYQAEYRSPQVEREWFGAGLSPLMRPNPVWMGEDEYEALELLAHSVGVYVVLRTRKPADAVRAMDPGDYGEANVARVTRMQDDFLHRFRVSNLHKEVISYPAPVGAHSIAAAEYARGLQVSA